MDVTTAVSTRYSVRGYLPDLVPESVIREVIDIARLAPSNSNTQPWHIAVISGEACRRLSEVQCELFDTGVEPNRAFPQSLDITGVYLDRRRACGYSYYETMGVTREDRAGRTAIARKNFEFFGAPHVAFLSMPATMKTPSAVDMGIFLQTLMLLFAERGIGCIAQGALASYPDSVREVAPIPEENGIVVGISFGYEDPDAHINTVRMPRTDLDSVASFIS